MQFEDFDNKVRQAADQHHPNYDGTAWAKMEKLLDKHLPQGNDGRRRIFFFLMLFVLLTGGSLLLIQKPWKENKRSIVSTEVANQKSPSQSGSIIEEDIPEKSTNGKTPANENKDQAPVSESVVKLGEIITNAPSQSLPVNSAPDTRTKNQLVYPRKSSRNDKSGNVPVSTSGIDKMDQPVKTLSGISVTKPEVSPSGNNLVNSSPDNKIKEPLSTDQSGTTSMNIKEPDKTVPPKQNVAETEVPVPANEEKMTKKPVQKRSNSFLISISAGPDVSSVGAGDPGKIKLLTGAGFGYSFKDKWILRTGFYSVSKIYSAKPKDYKFYNPPPNISYLQKIDADCEVFEIPISIAYNFSKSKRNLAFASLGLSSYIMKKEDYDYSYKYPSGSTVIHSWAYENKNSHYFSVLSLSGGYQRKISKTFAIMVEPYVKIPLAGVGNGKVKLNSAGVLLSLNISPFNSGVKK